VTLRHSRASVAQIARRERIPAGRCAGLKEGPIGFARGSTGASAASAGAGPRVAARAAARRRRS
jgi:hypothetical protein